MSPAEETDGMATACDLVAFREVPGAGSVRVGHPRHAMAAA
jgi:hypothetical protein